MTRATTALAAAGFDALAVKPATDDLQSVARRFAGTVVLDFEGRAHLPSPEVVADVARDRPVVVTAPVRADGFDPLGDDELLERYGEVADLAVVAGNGAYLQAHECRRGIATRLSAALDRHSDAWVGTEGIERVALATGATQYELLGRTTAREVRAMRTVGFEGDVVVYAPTVVSDDADVALDALGEYVARRRPVAERLPDGAATDATAVGHARAVLLEAVADYGIVGSAERVATRLEELRDAGVTAIVGLPATGH
ncbi:MAG: luciferase [Halobacteriales archaeon]